MKMYLKRYIDKLMIGILAFLMIIGISKDICIGFGGFLPFYELILILLNKIHSLIFAMAFILILFSVINKNSSNKIESKMALANLKQAIMLSVFLALILIAGCFTYSLINLGIEKALVNEWSFNSSFSITERSPLVCFSLAMLLFSLRCLFLFYMIAFINTITEKKWGFWVVLLICFIDFRFYEQTHIMYPLNILPIEHTRILYTSAFASPQGEVSRISYLASILYWVFLLIIIYEITKFTYKRRGKNNEE